MKKNILPISLLAVALSLGTQSVSAQIKLNSKSIGALEKGAKAVTFSDADAAKLATQAVTWMDANNPVASAKDPYTIRLNKIFAKHKNEGGLTLNYKVYKVRPCYKGVPCKLGKKSKILTKACFGYSLWSVESSFPMRRNSFRSPLQRRKQ